MSNNFLTWSGAPSLCTEIFSGPVLSINDLRSHHTYRGGTHLKRGVLGAAGTRKIGVDRATRSRFVGVGRKWMLRCGIPRLRQVWRGTDYEARDGETG